ncbi:MAG: hypothetical protein ACPHKZ_05160 [Candidatus Thalassarchaeaceae archaeon]
MSQSESAPIQVWRPAAMVEVDTDAIAPAGFTSHLMRGLRFRLNLLEPKESLSTIEGWIEATDDLEAWGELPNEITNIEMISTDRGPIYNITAENGNWLAEIQPWGGSKIRPRSRIAPEGSDVPCGGYQFEEADLILIRRQHPSNVFANSVLVDHLERNDLDSATTLIHRCGSKLGEYHSLAEKEWTNPPDQRRWNERFGEIEQRLKAASLWRAPFTRGAPATLSLGDVRFSMFSEDKEGKMILRLGPSRLANGLIETNLDLPGIRDLASLLHDLSRLHYHTESTLQLSQLRSSLISGWCTTAPPKWCSKRSLSAHTGGLVIWEYEQALLDVVEAVSHQSGRPEPAVTLIEKVPVLQKSLFSSRIISAASWIFLVLGSLSLYQWINLAIDDTIFFPLSPIVLFSTSFFFRHRYQSAAPPPEEPIHC